MVERLIWPLVPAEVRPRCISVGWYLTREAVGLDGTGALPREVAAALESLTGLEGLAVHTLLPWEPVLAERNPGALRRGSKRRCSRCFEEWRRRGLEPWEPLLWRLGPVVRCPVHRTLLSHLCPSCGQPQALVPKRVPMGRCARCGACLHVGDPLLASGGFDPEEDSAARWEWWLALAAARMLSQQVRALEHAGPFGFQRLLVESVRDLADGRSNRLAEQIGISTNGIRRWANGECLPRLEYFLTVCMRLGEDPAAVALAPYGTPFGQPWAAWRLRSQPWPKLRPRVKHRHVRYTPEHWASVGPKLDAAVAEGGRRSATEIARSLGVSLPGLREHYPAKVAVLVDLHRRCQEEARRARHDAQERAVRAAVASLAREGVYPSAKRVFDRAGLGLGLGSPRLKAVWRDAQRRAGIVLV